MSEPAHPAPALAADALAAMAAALWPSLSPADRRERLRQALGLRPCGEWPGAGMVYVEARPAE